jgi:hypothetical protein
MVSQEISVSESSINEVAMKWPHLKPHKFTINFSAVHVGFVVKKLALEQIFYFNPLVCPCQLLCHPVIHPLCNSLDTDCGNQNNQVGVQVSNWCLTFLQLPKLHCAAE